MFPLAPKQGGLPYFSIGGISSFGTVFNYPPMNMRTSPNYWIMSPRCWAGTHSEAGLASRKYAPVSSLPSGVGATCPTGANSPASLALPNTGYGVADFLANLQTSATVSNPSNADDIRWYWGAYIQDDFKASSKLTLNLGLRYDYFQPYYEKLSRMANFVA